MKKALIGIAVLALLLAAAWFSYDHFVTDQIMDRGGMMRDDTVFTDTSYHSFSKKPADAISSAGKSLIGPPVFVNERAHTSEARSFHEFLGGFLTKETISIP